MESLMKTFTAVMHKEEDCYVAECPELRTISQGKTEDEALANLKEATELYLEEFPTKDVSTPIIKKFKVC